jgi:hypothetical protein
MDWKIDTIASRRICSMDYLQLCSLIAHGPSNIDIHSEGVVTKPADYVLYARQPNELCCLCSILMPVFYSNLVGSVNAAHNLIQGLVDQNGEGYFTAYFTHTFFQATNLKRLLLVSSWNMDEGFDPSQSDSSSFTVYYFVHSLRVYAHLPARLHTDGLPLLQVKQVAQFILAWFRSFDVPYGLQDARFDQSILGSRLIYLATLLDHHQVHNLWENRGRKVLTFVWLSSVRSLLHLDSRGL